MRRASEPKALTKLLARVDAQATPASVISLSNALAEWLRGAELEAGTREAYEGYVEHYIKPVLGTASIAKLTVRQLEGLYGKLRRCRAGCAGKPFVEHRAVDDHDELRD